MPSAGSTCTFRSRSLTPTAASSGNNLVAYSSRCPSASRGEARHLQYKDSSVTSSNSASWPYEPEVTSHVFAATMNSCACNNRRRRPRARKPDHRATARVGGRATIAGGLCLSATGLAGLLLAYRNINVDTAGQITIPMITTQFRLLRLRRQELRRHRLSPPRPARTCRPYQPVTLAAATTPTPGPAHNCRQHPQSTLLSSTAPKPRQSRHRRQSPDDQRLCGQSHGDVNPGRRSD